jgi:hypothetical protein
MNLQKKRTNKEQSILDEAFFMTAKKHESAIYASMAIQHIITSLLVTRWLAAFGMN